MPINKKIITIGSVVLILAATFFSGFHFLKNKTMQKIDYTIPSVPYIGIYNHKGPSSYIFDDVASAVSSVLEYWNPEEQNNLLKIQQSLQPKAGYSI